ncbi:MAG: hypothetical protein H6617_00295 [Bdellovibrionaceae bacterium]|nr:hypothetical protein [Bdellovibrionales bacterium]MCB9253107.1 hypothetical protein [Pseudobdellovibrionaceae bacterium]
MGGTIKRSVLIAAMLLSMPLFARQYSIQLAYGDESSANERLAKKLLHLLGTSELTVGQYSPSNQTDANSKNPFGSRSTYHSYTWSYCLKWTTSTLCERWLDPYVSGHGLGGSPDQSPLETGIASLWAGLKKDIDANEAGSGAMQYGIWNVAGGRQGRSTLNNGVNGIGKRNTLDTSALTEWDLVQEAKDLARDVGRKTADLAILQTYESEDKSGKVMPNMESLRAMAATWTRALRNRLLSNVGEARAAQAGIEFELGEDRPTCEAYLANVDFYEGADKSPGAVPLPLRDLRTYTNQDPQDRYNLCKQVTGLSVYSDAPTVDGQSVTGKNPRDAAYDAVVSAANVAMIDFVGYDPNKITQSAGLSFDQEDISQEIVDYEVGGQEFQKYQATNMRQIASYNNALSEAAAAMRGAAARSDFIKDNSDQINSFKIAKESRNLMQINGLTDGMKLDTLSNTSIASAPIYQQTGVFTSNPDDPGIEKEPSRLTISTLGTEN